VAIPAVQNVQNVQNVQIRDSGRGAGVIDLDPASGPEANEMVRLVADRAGAVWIATERHMRGQLEREGLAKGGRPSKTASNIEAVSTLAERGLPGSAGYYRGVRAKTLPAVPERECKRLIKKAYRSWQGGDAETT
jgi:hypothetical protein